MNPTKVLIKTHAGLGLGAYAGCAYRCVEGYYCHDLTKIVYLEDLAFLPKAPFSLKDKEIKYSQQTSDEYSCTIWNRLETTKAVWKRCFSHEISWVEACYILWYSQVLHQRLTWQGTTKDTNWTMQHRSLVMCRNSVIEGLAFTWIPSTSSAVSSR